MKEKKYTLKAGDVVFIDCRKPYSHSTGSISSTGKKRDGDKPSADIDTLWSLRWCHFYGPSLPAIYAKYYERGGEPVIHTVELQKGMVKTTEAVGNTITASAAIASCGHPDTLSPYTSLLADIYNIASSSDYIRDMRINEKLNTLLTLLMESSWHQGSGSNAPKKMEIQNVKAYLDEHYAEKMSLDSVAASFFIDKYYLTRLFKERYGVTITTYLQQVRITHAKRMLRFTDKRVEETGLECGIGELNYFSRVFKKLEGVSPSEYRKLW